MYKVGKPLNEVISRDKWSKAASFSKIVENCPMIEARAICRKPSWSSHTTTTWRTVVSFLPANQHRMETRSTKLAKTGSHQRGMSGHFSMALFRHYHPPFSGEKTHLGTQTTSSFRRADGTQNLPVTKENSFTKSLNGGMTEPILRAIASRASRVALSGGRMYRSRVASGVGVGAVNAGVC